METDETLGILVNSNQYFDFVLKLAEAATAKGKHVKIHLQGPGLDLIALDSFEHLLNMARISISAAGLHSSVATVQQKFSKSVEVVTPKKLNRMLNECKRHVVF
jgi:hypothetical protein